MSCHTLLKPFRFFGDHETLPIMSHRHWTSEKSHQHSDYTLAFIFISWYFRTVCCHISLKALFMHFACCQLHYSLFVLCGSTLSSLFGHTNSIHFGPLSFQSHKKKIPIQIWALAVIKKDYKPVLGVNMYLS